MAALAAAGAGAMAESADYRTVAQSGLRSGALRLETIEVAVPEMPAAANRRHSIFPAEKAGTWQGREAARFEDRVSPEGVERLGWRAEVDVEAVEAAKRPTLLWFSDGLLELETTTRRRIVRLLLVRCIGDLRGRRSSVWQGFPVGFANNSSPVVIKAGWAQRLWRSPPARRLPRLVHWAYAEARGRVYWLRPGRLLTS